MGEPQEISITGLGIRLPGCDTPSRFWRQLAAGESQLALEPDPNDPEHQIAVGRIAPIDPQHYAADVPPRFFRKYTREVQIYLASLFDARRDARLELDRCDPTRIGLFDGCSRPMMAALHERLRGGGAASTPSFSRRDLMLMTPGQAAGVAASLLEARGPVYTFNGTCASGAIAIGHALRELQAGAIDVAFASGHDACLVPALFAMYRDGGLLSTEQEDASRAVRPFGDGIGNAFGEGAVTLALEPKASAEARGARIYATLRAYRYGNNGFHPTTPDLSGGQPARLIRDAVAAAGLRLDDIGFVVGHGNGVQLSDASEENYMLLVFGDRARDVPLLSNKPIYGHTLGAASAVNAAAAALMLHHQHLTPTANAHQSRHLAEGGAARSCAAGVAVSLGLGGNNAILVLGR